MFQIIKLIWFLLEERDSKKRCYSALWRRFQMIIILEFLLYTQNGNELDRVDKNVVSGSTNNLTIESSPQVDMQTLHKIISDKVKCAAENVVATVETRVHHAILSSKDNLFLPRVELAMKSVDASSTRIPVSVTPRSEGFLRKYKWPIKDCFV